jgi:hypothetical protein
MAGYATRVDARASCTAGARKPTYVFAGTEMEVPAASSE